MHAPPAEQARSHRAATRAGRLITVEGIDGVGKTTHAALLAEHLREQGLMVAELREPGGTPLGEKLRVLIKEGVVASAIAELLLFCASRAELVNVKLKPLLHVGEWVVLDRFTESTLAYQGALTELDEETIEAVCRAATGGIVPDLTFWLDLDPAKATNRRYPLAQEFRAGGGSAVSDAIEGRDVRYFTRVREIYERLRTHDPGRIVRVDAAGTIEETAAAILTLIDERMAEWNSG